MRITNKIMHNNSIYNINNNKVTENDINTQIATGKKLARPSDDPVIAIRALRLRSNVTELTQFYDKNAKDAESWLKVTQDSLKTVTDVITSLISQANKGVNQYQTLDDATTILTEMKALSDEYYSVGNEDYAGRYIFTGYRTQQTLTYQEEATALYKKINDQFNASDVDESRRVIGSYRIAPSDINYPRESDITETSVGRMRMSYNNIDSDLTNMTLRYRTPMTVPATTELSTSEEHDTLCINYKDVNGITRKINLSTLNDRNSPITVEESDGSITEYYAERNDEGVYIITSLNRYVDDEGYEHTSAMTMSLNQSGVVTASDVAATMHTKDDKMDLTYTDDAGIEHVAEISRYQMTEVEETDGSITKYTVNDQVDNSGSCIITAVNTISGTSVFTISSSGRTKGYDVTTIKEATRLSTFKFTDNGVTVSMTAALTGASDAPYTMKLEADSTDPLKPHPGYSLTVNTDGTYQISNEKAINNAGQAESNNPCYVVNLSANGSVHSSYVENIVTPGIAISDAEGGVNYLRDISETAPMYMTNESEEGVMKLTYNANGKSSQIVLKDVDWTTISESNPLNIVIEDASGLKTNVRFTAMNSMDDHPVKFDVTNGTTRYVNVDKKGTGVISKNPIIDATTEEHTIDAIYNSLAGNEKLCYTVNAATGEVLLSDGLKKKLMSLNPLINADTINITYDKSAWVKGDTRPENLFRCTSVDDGVKIVYNGGNAGHTMEYDIGYGQVIAVNTTADEVFTNTIKRDVEDLDRLIGKMKDLDSKIKTMKENLAVEEKNGGSTKVADIKIELGAAQKSYDYLKEELKDMFGEKISTLQNALDKANVAVTENGTRSSRLNMTQTRLQGQLTTFKTLQSDNEDIDLAETATNLSTAQLTYQASLMATSKIMQESLMNYI